MCNYSPRRSRRDQKREKERGREEGLGGEGEEGKGRCMMTISVITHAPLTRPWGWPMCHLEDLLQHLEGAWRPTWKPGFRWRTCSAHLLLRPLRPCAAAPRHRLSRRRSPTLPPGWSLELWVSFLVLRGSHRQSRDNDVNLTGLGGPEGAVWVESQFPALF